MKQISKEKNNNVSHKINVEKLKVPVYKKGITLVSLVVTIVILLILATVTISMAINSDGLLEKVKTVKEEHRAGVVKDNSALWRATKDVMRYQEEEYTTRDEMMWDLYKKDLLTKLELNIGKYKQRIQIASQTIDFGEDNGVKKIEVMNNPPEIECLRKIRRN